MARVRSGLIHFKEVSATQGFRDDTGRKRDKLKRAEIKSAARELAKEMAQELEDHGERLCCTNKLLQIGAGHIANNFFQEHGANSVRMRSFCAASYSTCYRRASRAFAALAGSPTEGGQNCFGFASIRSEAPAPRSGPALWQCTRCQGPMRVVERLTALQIFYPQSRRVHFLDSS